MIVGGSIEGLDALRARIQLMRDRTANLEPALLRAGLVALKAAADRIDSGGPGWAPNTTGTPLLHHTGRLLSSLSVGAAGNVTQEDGDAITVGTNVKYAAWLQDGTGIYGDSGEPITPLQKKALSFMLGGRRITVRSIKGTPKRPFLYFDDAVATTVRNVFATYVVGSVADADV